MQNELNNVISHLENGVSELQDIIETRFEFYYFKPNEWQESDDGFEFLDETIKMEDMMHELELIIDKIKAVIYE